MVGKSGVSILLLNFMFQVILIIFKRDLYFWSIFIFIHFSGRGGPGVGGEELLNQYCGLNRTELNIVIRLNVSACL